MKQIVWIINCYLYGATLVLLVVLALLVYLRGQANHLPNPFARRNIVYRPKEKAQDVKKIVDELHEKGMEELL